MGYDPEKDATVVVVTKLYSVPDGSQPAKEIARLIIQESYLAPTARGRRKALMGSTRIGS